MHVPVIIVIIGVVCRVSYLGSADSGGQVSDGRLSLFGPDLHLRDWDLGLDYIVVVINTTSPSTGRFSLPTSSYGGHTSRLMQTHADSCIC